MVLLVLVVVELEAVVVRAATPAMLASIRLVAANQFAKQKPGHQDQDLCHPTARHLCYRHSCLPSHWHRHFCLPSPFHRSLCLPSPCYRHPCLPSSYLCRPSPLHHIASSTPCHPTANPIASQSRANQPQPANQAANQAVAVVAAIQWILSGLTVSILLLAPGVAVAL